MANDNETMHLVARTFGACEVRVSNLAVKRTVVDRRVPGGYMNRWLVRERRVVEEPCCFSINDGVMGIAGIETRKVLVMHPTILAKMKAKLDAELDRIRDNVTGLGRFGAGRFDGHAFERWL
jgi:hypothetical protein